MGESFAVIVISITGQRLYGRINKQAAEWTSGNGMAGLV